MSFVSMRLLSKFARSAAAAAACFITSGSLSAWADDFPARTVRLVVGYSAGGGIDAVSRILTEEVGRAFPQPFIVENKPGAGGTIAADHVAKSAPDGHTLMTAAAGATVINPHLMKLSYETSSFAGVTLIGQGPMLLIVRADSPIKSLQDLVERAKSKPNGITYGSPGMGTTNHLAALTFELAAGIKLQHIPYKGPAANTDLIAGRIDMVVDAITTASSFIRDGRVRALAVTTAKRSPSLPDVPSVAELGYADIDVANWYGIVAPKGTPKAVIDKLNAAYVTAINKPETKEKLSGLGFDPIGSSPAELDKFMTQQSERYGKAIKASGLKLQ